MRMAERKALRRKLEGLHDAMTDGRRSPGLKEELLTLKARVATDDAESNFPAPSAVRLLPNLSELHRRKGTELAITRDHPAIAGPARQVVRGLIERASVTWEDRPAVISLDRALTALIGLARNAKGPAVARRVGIDVS